MIDSLSGIVMRLMFLAVDLGITAPGAPQAPGVPAAPPAAGVPAQVPPDAANGGGGFPMIIWVVYGAVFVGLYFLFIRPQRKREKQRKEMVAAIKTGDNVVTTGGLFGKVADVGEDSFLIEFGTNRGLRIPVLKTDVLGIREPKLTPPPKIDP